MNNRWPTIKSGKIDRLPNIFAREGLSENQIKLSPDINVNSGAPKRYSMPTLRNPQTSADVVSRIKPVQNRIGFSLHGKKWNIN